MPQKVSMIKWSNSFPGIISIVYAEIPTLVFLYDSSLLTTPGKFYEMDPNREHGSVRYFNDTIACMDWGYNSCNNCLAFGFANGDVIVRSCKGGIFKDEIYKKVHDSQSQSCICLSWRVTQNHVAAGYVKDENNYCIDIHDVSNHSLVIPWCLRLSLIASTISCSRVILSLHWVERKNAKDRDGNAVPARAQTKHYNYMVLGGSKERIEDTPDLLLVGYENYIQVMAIQSSSHQILYSVAMSYCRLATINSQLAVVCEYKSLSPSFIPDATATRQHMDIEYETPFQPPAKGPRGVSFDFRDASFMSKKKESESNAVNSKEVGATSFGKNAFVYDISYSGKLELKLSFVHSFSSILRINWYSKTELFIADSRGYMIVNTWTGEVLRYMFPGHDTRVLQCAIDKMEHPIITRVIVYMENKSLFWDTVVPVLYRCMSFANTHLLCVANGPSSFDWEDTLDLVNDDVFEVVRKRCGAHYGMDVQTNIQVCMKEFIASRDVSHTDLFFFWSAFHLLSQLDEEGVVLPSMSSPVSQLDTGRRVVKEEAWIEKGVIEVIDSSTVYREEKCGRMRVYIQDKKERLVKKMMDAYNAFNDNVKRDVFRHILVLVVQCKFEEAIAFINNIASSISSKAGDPNASVGIDRLLVICNVLTSIHAAKGDLQLIETNILFQLNYYKKETTPILFKILQFLLLYIRYDTDTNYTRIREQNDRAIQAYLAVTKTSSFLEFEDLLVALRYLSTPVMMEYRIPAVSVSRVVRSLKILCIREGYLLGLVLAGLGASSTQSLLQHFVNRTSDVQSVSVLSVYNYNVFRESELWIKNYIDVLSRANLFCERCAMENRIYMQYGVVMNNQGEHSERFIPGVIVCPDCNTKILPLNTNTSSWKGQSLATPCCVTCQRPLFTCSLCSLPVRQESSEWLVWCSSCHHGGHYAHIAEWFASHEECPVNGCHCHCSELCPVCSQIVS